TGHLDLGKRAGRPELRSGLVWVGVSDDGGQTLLVDPRTLRVVRPLSCCRLGKGYDAVDAFGWNWDIDWSHGAVERWNPQTSRFASATPVVEQPFYGGPCLTSIATGAGAVWITVAPSIDDQCVR